MARIELVAYGAVIGLTGDVGAGKSSVRQWLEARGVPALDADVVVHQLLAEDPAVRAAVAARFGPGVMNGDEVVRSALAKVVFSDAAALADLERLLHPAVLAASAAWLAEAGPPVRVVEAVKLIEGGMVAQVDRVWLVTCERSVRLSRLVARGWSREEAVRRMAAGPALAPRLAQADVVIDNSGAWLATERQLVAAWADLGGDRGHIR
jgi:dephospho-CoA kinase